MTNSDYKAKFERGSRLIKGRINVDGRRLPNPGFFERIRLRWSMGFFKKAAELAPMNGAPFFMLAKIEDRLGNFGACVWWLEKAIALESENPILTLELGAALGRLGLHQKSVAVLAPAARAHPNNPRIHCNLGLSLLMSGDGTGAKRSFENLIKLEPELPLNQRLLDFAIAVSEKRKSVPRNESDIVRNI